MQILTSVFWAFVDGHPNDSREIFYNYLLPITWKFKVRKPDIFAFNQCLECDCTRFLKKATRAARWEG